MKYTKAFYSPQEAAELMEVSLNTIMNYIATDYLYAVEISAQNYRIPVRAIVRILNPELLAPSTRTENLEVDIEAELAEELAFWKEQDNLITG